MVQIDRALLELTWRFQKAQQVTFDIEASGS
jgi:hypothetical protein